MAKHPLDLFMRPRSVVVIGASRKTGEGSFNVIENMRSFGYRGKIFPVNPFAEEIAGLKVYGHVRDLPESVELAIVAAPREQVPEILEDCAATGIRGAIVVPQGFADADDTGKMLQNRLSEIARQQGIRILGPNTLGVQDAFSGFTSSFMPLKREKAPVGVICQSGIFFVGAAVFTGTMGKGIDVANGCDLDFADALAYFGTDDEIRLIFAHIEGTTQGRAFLEEARKVVRKKPVIAYKTAKSRWGQEAASSHSGAMVGDIEVFEAAFRQTGIISAREPEEVQDYTKALLKLPPMKGNRIGIITFTGAGGIILVDALQDYGLELADLSEETLSTIKDLSPPWMLIQNPLDIWPALMKNGLKHVYRVALEAILRDPGVDGAICIAIAPDLTDGAYLDATAVIEETAGAFPDKPVAAWLYGPNQAPMMEKVDRGGKVACFPTPPRAARAMAVLHKRHRFLAREPSIPPSFPENTEAVALSAQWAREGRKKVEGEDAGGLLRHYGIPVARTRFCLDLEEILGAAEAIGYPVALKVSSPRITHKTEVGGLRLGLNGPGELEAAHATIAEAIERRGFADGGAGFLVQEMVHGGHEVILGAKRDPQFGPTLVFGRGGIHTEVWRDIAYGIAPLSEEIAWDMINQTRVSNILSGVRGEAGCDMALLRDCLMGLSRLMTDLEAVREIDINPFKALREDGKAVDIRIILETIPPDGVLKK